MAGQDLVPRQVPPPDLLASRFAGPPAVMPAVSGDAGDGDDAGPLVRRLLDLLDTLAPVEAALARGCLPRCDSTFGAGLALFLAATAGGCRDWIGADAADELSDLDGGLLIDECERALAARFQPVEGRVWRLSRVPLLDGDGGLLCAVGIEDGPSDRVTLVLQARPQRLGPVQLMATLGGRRLDVTLRSAAGLPAAVLAGLHEACRTTLADVGLQGDLTIGPLAGAWLVLDEDPGADVVL